MCETRLKKALSVAATTIGLSAAFWPLILWYLRRLTDGGDEPLGLAVLGLLALVIFKDRHLPRRPHLVAAAVCFLLYLISGFYLPPMLRSLPAIACLMFYFGYQNRPSCLALMLLSLPLVASLQFYLGYPMRLFSAEVSRWLVLPFVQEITREGTNLTAFGKVVGVDPPCSGVRILWMGLVVTNVIASLKRMPWHSTVLFNLLAMVLLLLTNSLRAALLFAPECGFLEISDTLHAATGLLCYLGAVIILIKVASWQSAVSRTRLVS
ncbi:archaeosortase/exosortase family protein [Verrucomicrobiaceae bacterium 5K15]|uniref:Archaeosortase/exosortase family protein n=1 Tax=Oceaniferula flava TaxID=2800421 RepID=A0AAE2VCC3_9BACT|nr:archaeosortase/exosortase family protein [Oceaniferula flavus]MBK1854816.1 archaeosortase/exosortase family protein [Oceaniferula flavus]MBM1136122.1 archaeosortase/exosortase family protein [Oceaniferula flavus]